MCAQSRAAGGVPRAGLAQTQPCTELSPPAGGGGGDGQPGYPQQLLLGCTGGGRGARPGPISAHSPELCATARRVPPQTPAPPRAPSLHGDPAAPGPCSQYPALSCGRTRTPPPPKRRAAGGGRPRSVAVGGAPLAYVAARALRGWPRVGVGVTPQPYKQRDPPERLPRAVPRGEAPETPAGSPPEPQERCACARRAGEARGALPTPREPGRLLWQRASLAPP